MSLMSVLREIIKAGRLLPQSKIVTELSEPQLLSGQQNRWCCTIETERVLLFCWSLQRVSRERVVSVGGACLPGSFQFPACGSSFVQLSHRGLETNVAAAQLLAFEPALTVSLCVQLVLGL